MGECFKVRLLLLPPPPPPHLRKEQRGNESSMDLYNWQDLIGFVGICSKMEWQYINYRRSWPLLLNPSSPPPLPPCYKTASRKGEQLNRTALGFQYSLWTGEILCVAFTGCSRFLYCQSVFFLTYLHWMWYSRFSYFRPPPRWSFSFPFLETRCDAMKCTRLRWSIK